MALQRPHLAALSWVPALVLLLCPPAHAADVSGSLAGLGFWLTAFVLTVPLTADWAARRFGPALTAPNRKAWLAGFLLWICLASLGSTLGADWLWIPLGLGLLWIGQRLATQAAWPGRLAWRWSLLSLAGPFAFALGSGAIVFGGQNLGGYGFWLLGIPVWLLWLRRRRHKPLYLQHEPSPPTEGS